MIAGMKSRTVSFRAMGLFSGNPVADAPDGFDMVRPISEFPAQVYHMHVDRTRRDGIVVSFDFPYDLVAGEDLSGICRQQCQSPELIGGQLL